MLTLATKASSAADATSALDNDATELINLLAAQAELIRRPREGAAVLATDIDGAALATLGVAGVATARLDVTDDTAVAT